MSLRLSTLRLDGINTLELAIVEVDPKYFQTYRVYNNLIIWFLTWRQNGDVDVRPVEGVEQGRHRLADQHQLLEVGRINQNLKSKNI